MGAHGEEVMMRIFKCFENQIDHVAINKMWTSLLQEARVTQSADAGSIHHPVVAVIKMKLLALKKPR